MYKACDIRGKAGTELRPELYRSWGLALGNRLRPGECFVVGGDVRESTPASVAALIDGLVAAGVQTVDLGIVPTPLVYFAQRDLEASACAMVTASHSPPDINGLKWQIGGQPPDEAEVQSLEHAAGHPRPGGRRRPLDVGPRYGEWLRQAWGAGSGVAVRVVADPGQGCWAGRVAPYLRDVLPTAQVTAIHDRADGRFPERGPDCARPENLAALSRSVRSERADLGIAFDGDGDRVAFVDDEGGVLTAEETTQILLACYGAELKGRAFVHDIKFSDRVPEAAQELGAVPHPERSGHAFIRSRMLETGARFGAEISGHYFDADLAGGDDGLYTACRMIRHLAATGQRLADLRRACRPVYMTPDVRLSRPMDERFQDEVLDRIATVFADRPQSTVDGVRVDFPRGWALVRKSVTEARLTLRFEGHSEEDLASVVDRFCSELPELTEDLSELHSRYGKDE